MGVCVCVCVRENTLSTHVPSYNVGYQLAAG